MSIVPIITLKYPISCMNYISLSKENICRMSRVKETLLVFINFVYLLLTKETKISFHHQPTISCIHCLTYVFHTFQSSVHDPVFLSGYLVGGRPPVLIVLYSNIRLVHLLAWLHVSAVLLWSSYSLYHLHYICSLSYFAAWDCLWEDTQHYICSTWVMSMGLWLV